MPIFLGSKEGTLSYTDSLENSGGVIRETSKSEILYYALGDDVNDTKADIEAITEIPDLGAVVNGEKVITVSPKETMTVVHPNTGVTTYLWEIKVVTDSNFTL